MYINNIYVEKNIVSLNDYSYSLNKISINNEYKNFNLYTSLEIDNYQIRLNELHSENDNLMNNTTNEISSNENESLEIEQISIQNNKNYLNYLSNLVFETVVSNIYDNCYYFIDWIIGIWDFSRIFNNDINVFEQLSSPGPVEALEPLNIINNRAIEEAIITEIIQNEDINLSNDLNLRVSTSSSSNSSISSLSSEEILEIEREQHSRQRPRGIIINPISYRLNTK
jgi:hypothetical protein